MTPEQETILAKSCRPKALAIHIELPLLRSARHVQLDVSDDRLVLHEEKSKSKYHLDLPMPYPVFGQKGTAKFDKGKRTLTVTVPVRAPEAPIAPPPPSSPSPTTQMDQAAPCVPPSPTAADTSPAAAAAAAATD